MAVALAQDRQLVSFDQGLFNLPSPSTTIDHLSLIGFIPKSTPPSAKEAEAKEAVEKFERTHKFKIAYYALADRRGINATPEGRTASRKVWLDHGADAAKWLIDRLRTEQHPEMVIGIAETITALGQMALPVALLELECSEATPEYAPLIEALAWMAPPSQPQLISRIISIMNRYLASPHIDCQVAAVQLTRLLDDDMARAHLDKANRNARQRLREEIMDLMNEGFDE